MAKLEKKKYNIFINIVFETESEVFPNEYGTISKIKRNLRKAILDDPSFSMKRYNYDIQEHIPEQEEGSFKQDDDGVEL